MKRNTTLMTRAGQITLNNWRMFFQVNAKLGKWLLIFYLALFLLACFVVIKGETALQVMYYYWAHVQHLLRQNHHQYTIHYLGRPMVQTVQDFLTNPYYRITARHFWLTLMITALVLMVPYALGYHFVAKWLVKKGAQEMSDQYIRGAKLAPVAVANQAIAHPSAISIDALQLLHQFERQHVFVHGTNGSGKTVLYLKLLSQVRQLAQKWISVDIAGNLLSRLYKPGDIILSPFDARSVRWDMWNDCPTLEDLYTFSTFLIPDNPKTEPIWINAPRQIFVATAEKMRDKPERSLTALLKVLLSLPLSEYARYFEGTDVASLTSDQVKKTTLSIRLVLASYLKPLRYLDQIPRDVPEFSIMKWLKNDDDKRCVFITVRESQHAALRGLISAWLGMTMKGILSLPEDIQKTRDIWIIADEFASSHKVAGAAENMSKMRKFGGHMLMAVQSQPQLVKHYGQEETKELIDQTSLQVYFRSNEETVARFVSQQLGEQEIEEVREQYSMGSSQIRDGVSFGKTIVKRQLVLPSEIQSLRNLDCYVKQGQGIPHVLLTLDLTDVQKMGLVTSAYESRAMTLDKDLEELLVAIRFHQHVLTERALQEVVATTSDNIQQETARALNIAGKKDVKKVLDAKKVTEEIAMTAEKAMQAEEQNIAVDEKDGVEI